MQIQINTDRNIEGHEALIDHVSTVVKESLSQLSDHITRVEVHLADENGPKKAGKDGQNDKRCMMEARLQGFPPLAVTAHAASVHQAVGSAADKLARMVESTLGRLHDQKRRRNAVELPEETPPEA